MSMFKELFQMALGATLSLTISADEKRGQLTINVIPKPKNDAGEAALSEPVTLTATPEEFDAEFIGILGRYRGARASLSEQAQVTLELLDAAKAASAKKGTTAVARASGKTAQPAKRAAPVERAGADADDETDTDSADQDGGDQAGEGAASTVAGPTSADTEPQLFG